MIALSETRIIVLLRQSVSRWPESFLVKSNGAGIINTSEFVGIACWHQLSATRFQVRKPIRLLGKSNEKEYLYGRKKIVWSTGPKHIAIGASLGISRCGTNRVNFFFLGRDELIAIASDAATIQPRRDHRPRPLPLRVDCFDISCLIPILLL